MSQIGSQKLYTKRTDLKKTLLKKRVATTCTESQKLKIQYLKIVK